MNSPEAITLDRGNGYMRLKVGGVLVRWTSRLSPQEFIIEAPDGRSRTVVIEVIEAALARLTETVSCSEKP